MRSLWNKMVRFVRDLWYRYRMGDLLKRALAVALLEAAQSVLQKDYASPARVKCAVRNALSHAVERLRLPESYRSWLLEPLLELSDQLIDRHYGDNGAVLNALRVYLYARLGIRD